MSLSYLYFMRVNIQIGKIKTVLIDSQPEECLQYVLKILSSQPRRFNKKGSYKKETETVYNTWTSSGAQQFYL